MWEAVNRRARKWRSPQCWCIPALLGREWLHGLSESSAEGPISLSSLIMLSHFTEPKALHQSISAATQEPWEHFSPAGSSSAEGVSGVRCLFGLLPCPHSGNVQEEPVVGTLSSLPVASPCLPCSSVTCHACTFTSALDKFSQLP